MLTPPTALVHSGVVTQVVSDQNCQRTDHSKFVCMVVARWSGCFCGSLRRNTDFATQLELQANLFSSTLAAASVPSVRLQFAALNTSRKRHIVNIRITLCAVLELKKSFRHKGKSSLALLHILK